MLNDWASGSLATENLLFLVLPAASIIPVVSTLRRVWHQRTFGTSILEMDTMPARLGHTLEARVQAGIDTGTTQQDPFDVTLTCYHRRTSGDDTSWRTVWKAETKERGRRALDARAKSTDGKSEIPISIELPGDAPPSTPEKKRNRIAWVLEVSAERRGIDYQSYFEIPVFDSEVTD